MKNDVVNPVLLAFEVKDILEYIIKCICGIPMPQAIIVFTAIGVILGHYTQASFESILVISKWLCWLFVFGLGSLTLYLLHYEKRTHKKLLGLSTLMMFFIATLLMIDKRPEMVRFLLHTLLIFGSVIIFLLTAKNYRYTRKVNYHANKSE